jgi:hypothetical protein
MLPDPNSQGGTWGDFFRALSTAIRSIPADYLEVRRKFREKESEDRPKPPDDEWNKHGCRKTEPRDL